MSKDIYCFRCRSAMMFY